MKTIRRWLVALSMVFVVGGSGVSTIPQTAYAIGSCGNATFFTFPAWYKGLTKTDANGVCNVDQTLDPKKFALTIASNIVQIILQLVGYISTGFIIYGGFLYMIATGDPGKLGGAKNTILNAVIGLVIAIFSTAIVNFVTERFI